MSLGNSAAGNRADKLCHLRSDAYSAEQLNKFCCISNGSDVAVCTVTQISNNLIQTITVIKTYYVGVLIAVNHN